jgi:hypothetical protein
MRRRQGESLDIRISGTFIQSVKDAAVELEKADDPEEGRTRLKGPFTDFYLTFKTPGPEEDLFMVLDGPELGLGPTHPPIYLISTLLNGHRCKSNPAE